MSDTFNSVCVFCSEDADCIADENGKMKCAECAAKPKSTNQPQLSEEQKELLKNYQKEIGKILIGNYSCGRVWEAWQYGTMRESDFSPLEQDEEILNDFDNLIIKLLKIKDLEAEQKVVKAVCRLKAEHDKYCGKMEKKDDWFEIAKKKLNL